MCVKCALWERLNLTLAIRHVLGATTLQLQSVLEICTARRAHLEHGLCRVTLCVKKAVGQTLPDQQQAATVCATKVTPEAMQFLARSALRESTNPHLVTTFAPIVILAKL